SRQFRRYNRFDRFDARAQRQAHFHSAMSALTSAATFIAAETSCSSAVRLRPRDRLSGPRGMKMSLALGASVETIKPIVSAKLSRPNLPGSQVSPAEVKR